MSEHKDLVAAERHNPKDHNHTATEDGGVLAAPELSNYIQATNVAAPPTPAAGKSRLFVRSSDKVLCTIDDAGTVRPYSTTSGTVTSVAMTVPTGFAISGSPVTTTGTLAVTESTQAANIVKAGPTSGGAATPAYRALVTADMPAGTGTVTNVTGTAPISVATGTSTPAITHNTSGVSAGTSSGITVDAKGHVTARTALVAGDLPAATVTAVGAVKQSAQFVVTSSTTVTNTTTESTLLGSVSGTKTLSANAFTAGRRLRITMWGTFHTNAVDEPIFIRVKFGSTAYIAVHNNMPSEDANPRGWKLEAYLTCRTTGGAGTFRGDGFVSFVVDSVGSIPRALFLEDQGNTANTAGALVLDVTAQWDGASTDYSITCTQAEAEWLN